MEENIPKIQIDVQENEEKSNPTETNQQQGELTGEEENYLKKELLSRAIHREVLFLKEETSLARLDQTTILKFFFANYLAEFPLLRKTKKKFWDRMQTLSANMEKLKLSNAIERGQETSSDKIFRRVERKIVLVMNSAIKITSSDWLLQAQASRNQATEGLFSSLQTKEDFEAKIYATRKVTEKRMTGTVTKMNYIIISKFGDQDGIVARSMSEIEELHGKLKKEFKDIKLPSMPKKIKVRSPTPEMIEKRRKDLNYYIRNILIHEEIRKSDLVRTFLFEDMTNLSENEQQNVDKTREQEVQDQLKEVALQKDIEDRTNQMFKVTSEFFEYLAANGGFPTFIKTLKDNPDITNLPENYQRLFELARLKISFLVYNTLHRDDGHQEAFDKFKNMYNLIPFTALVVILKISNPFLLLRGIFELFLARPFGAKSLMQRMLSLSMNDDMKEAKTEKTKLLEELGNDENLAKKVENFVSNEEARHSIGVTNVEDMSEDQYVKLVLTSDKIEPPISAQYIENLNEEQIDKIYQLIGMEFAARDAKLLISFMGNSEITDVIKEMFTMFYLPLVELYQKVDLGQLIKTVASYMKAVIKVAEDNKREVDGRKIFQQYLQIFKDHEQGIYKFINELLTQEAGILRELITWGYDFFEFMRIGNTGKPIDVNKFVDSVVGGDKEKIAELKKEVQAVKEFHIARHRRRAERLKYILTTLDKDQVGDAAGTSNWEFLDDEDEDEEDDVEHADENGNNTNSEATTKRAKNGNKTPQELPEHLKKIPAPKLTLVPTLVEAFVPLVADGLSGYKPKIVSVQTPWERIEGADKDPYLEMLAEDKDAKKKRSKSITKGKNPREPASEATTPKEEKKDRLAPKDAKESKSVPNSPRDGEGSGCNQQ